MHLHQNTFTGGLDTDTSVNKYSNSHYLKSENFRVIMGGENSTGAITTVDGNEEVISFNSSSGFSPVIIGLAELHSSLIVFVSHAPNTSIYEIPKVNLGGSVINIWWYTPTYRKLRKDFGHTSNSRIRVVSSKETNTIRKIYFTDSYTPIYSVNLADNNIQNYSVDRFSLISTVDFSKIEIENITSGVLKAGKIQYAYQLYNLQGAETVFSPPSLLINITKSGQSLPVRKYLGSHIDTVSGKGLILKLTNVDTRFDRIRLVRILYEVLDAPPKIQVFKELSILDSNDLKIVDTGSITLKELVLEEFNELLIDPIPETLESKNNYLFVGNTTEEPFDFDFDASTKRYRYNSSDSSYTPHQFDNNPFNHLSNDTQSTSQFKYHPKGFLGGKGDNTEYWFNTKKILIDRGKDLGDPYIKKLQTQDGSYANWEYASKYVGYQRDEVYRFGLMGYNNKGQSSFVKWIGDIRMPDYKDGIEEYTFDGSAQPATRKIVIDYEYVDSIEDYPNTARFSIEVENESGQNNTINLNFVEGDVSDLVVAWLENFKTNFNNSGFWNGTLKVKEVSVEDTLIVEGVIKKSLSFVFENTYENFEIEDCVFWPFTNHTDPISGHTLNDPSFTVTPVQDYQPPSQSYSINNNYNMITTEVDGDTLSVYANVLCPVFKIDVSQLPSDVVSYEIVRVERDRVNRTVIDTGIAFTIDNYHGFQVFPSANSGRSVLEYTSIDHLVNKLEGVVGDRLDILYPINRDAHIIRTDQMDNDYLGQTFYPTSIPECYIRNIADGMDYTNDPDINRLTTFGELTFNNGFGKVSTKGSTKLLKLQTNVHVSGATGGVIARRRNRYYPYGGTNDSAITNSMFISTGAKSSSGDSLEVWGGDVYIGYFNYLRGPANLTWKEDGASSSVGPTTQVFNFPVESSINPELLVSRDLNYYTLIASQSESIKKRDKIALGLQELAGAHLYNDGDFEEIFEQDFNLYTYNSVYSQNNSTKKFFPKPMDFEEVTEWPNRVYYSDKKISGEFSDSWLKIRPGNFTDLDTAYGELKLLKTFKDNLFFFQERGLGIIGVEQRELVQTDSPGPLIVGTGDILSPPHYFSTDVGIQDKWHVTNSRNVIYFYDGLNRKFCRIIENGIEFISDTKNVSTLFKKDLGKVRVSFNPKYNEVLISTKNEGVIAFNEYLDTFTSIYTTYHDISQLVGQELYTVGDTANKIFKDSDEGSNTWYNTPHEGKLTLIVNPVGNIVSVYDVLEFTLEIFGSTGLRPNDFLTSVKVYNEYQETETFSLDTKPIRTNIEQRFRTWRINTLVDSTDESRIRSSSMFIELTYDNSNKLVLHDIITKFRSNIRYQQKQSE